MVSKGLVCINFIYCRMVTTSSYSFQVLISNYLLGFLFCSLFKLSHPWPKLQSCIMAANVCIILIQDPGEKAILFMKRMFLVDFVSKGACTMVTSLYYFSYSFLQEVELIISFIHCCLKNLWMFSDFGLVKMCWTVNFIAEMTHVKLNV